MCTTHRSPARTRVAGTGDRRPRLKICAHFCDTSFAFACRLSCGVCRRTSGRTENLDARFKAVLLLKLRKGTRFETPSRFRKTRAYVGSARLRACREALRLPPSANVQHTRPKYDSDILNVNQTPWMQQHPPRRTDLPAVAGCCRTAPGVHRLQPGSHRVAAWIVRGCRPGHIGLQTSLS